jgi:hypothetical protein
MSNEWENLHIMDLRRNGWPVGPLQWNLAHLMTVIALAALGLGLFRLSLAMRLTLLISSGLVLGPPLLARRGYKLIDIVFVLAIAALTMAFLLPAMAQTRIRTAGQRTLPIKVPASFYSFLFGDS